MGKRKRRNSQEYIKKKIRKLERRLRQCESSSSSDDSHNHIDWSPDNYRSEGNIPVCDIPDSDASSPRYNIRSEINIPNTEPILPEPIITQIEAVPSTSAAVPTPDTGPENSNVLPLDILEALGQSKTKPEIFGPKIQEEISKRWGRIICEGLNKDQKKDLIDKILVPANFQLVKAPKLNPEIMAVLVDSTRNRDKRLEKAQNHLGMGIAALTNLISSLIDKDMDKIEIIKKLSETNQLLLDLHYGETLNRRKLITYSLDKKFLDITQDVKRDALLFGENLTDKIKATKSAEKSGLQIKKVNTTDASTSKKTIRPAQQGNWRDPPRQAQRGIRRGGAKSRPTYQSTRRPAPAPDRYQNQSKARSKHQSTNH